MLETVMPPDVLANLKPSLVAPLVGYLSHDSCKENGSVFEIGGGYCTKLRWQRAEGAFFDPEKMTAEDVVKSWK